MNKYDDLTTLTIDELLDRYVIDAVEYGRHMSVPGRKSRLWETSVVACCVAADRVGAVYCELRRRGRDAQERILDLLDHPEERVRNWARVDAMDFVPERFIPELENEAVQDGFAGSGARHVLKELREGTRKPYPDKRYRSKPTVTEAERWPPVSPEVADILGVTNNRLDTETPALGAAFRRVPLDERRDFAVKVTDLAIGENAIDADEVQDAEYVLLFEKLPAVEEHEKMTALATRLDDEARRQVPPDRDRWNERNAHAVRALAIALTGDSTRLDEVVHEAIASQQQPESFVLLLLERLQELNKQLYPGAA
jgi:hypothetical protein